MTASGCAEPLPAHQRQVGPWQVQSDWCAKWLTEPGYAHATAQEKLRLVAQLRQWLQERRLHAEPLDEHGLGQLLPDRPKRGGAPRHNRGTLPTCLTARRNAGLLPLPARQDSALDVRERTVSHSLVDARGLAPATPRNSLPLMRRLLQERCGTGPGSRNARGLHDGTQVLRRHAATTSPRRAQLLVAALRAFGRFLVHRGDLTTALRASAFRLSC
jgi:hypothetical protein